jgi:hypothetical protein
VVEAVVSVNVIVPLVLVSTLPPELTVAVNVKLVPVVVVLLVRPVLSVVVVAVSALTVTVVVPLLDA